MMRKISKCWLHYPAHQLDFKWPNKGQPKMFKLFVCLVDNQKIEAINDLLI